MGKTSLVGAIAKAAGRDLVRINLSEQTVSQVYTLQENVPRKCFFLNTVKPALRGHSKRRPKIGFKSDYPFMQVKSILQYFQPSLSYHLSKRPLFCLFLNGHLKDRF